MNTSNKLKNLFAVLLYVIIISTNNSCYTGDFGRHADSLFLETSNVAHYYDLKRPADKYFLPYVLAEISGLTYWPDDKLLTVDDETGKVFEYDLKKRDIVHSIEFARTADYEGVEAVSDDIYVLRSDGDLFYFKYTADKQLKADKRENILSRKNDTEGLGYDPQKGHLLIACKEEGGLGEEEIDGRSIYAYDPVAGSFMEQPLLILTPKKLASFWQKHKPIEYEVNRIKFKPSAIATHPVDKNYYILSSVGKLLVVVSKEGTIKATYPISPRILGQPEGIAFAPNGDMYISSEGEGDRGYILKFPMKKK